MKSPHEEFTLDEKKLVGMQFSNLSYFLLALYMASRHDTGASLVFFVFAVSTIHHFFAYDRNWLLFDIFVATSVTILLSIVYVPLGNLSNPLFLSGIGIFVIALVLFYTSGSNYNSTKFEVYHGLWHVLTALSFFLILKSEGK
jgi:hypothetical protein